MIEYINIILASSLVSGIASHVLTRKKYNLDIQKGSIELIDQLTDFYKSELRDMMTRLEELKSQVSKLEVELRSHKEMLEREQCIVEHCLYRDKSKKTNQNETLHSSRAIGN